MWTGCNNSFWINLIQNFHIRRSQPKENILTSGAASGVTSTLLVLSEHGKIDASRVQDLCKCLGSLLGARIGCRSAAHPPQKFRLRILLDGWDVQSLRPLHSICLRN